MSDKQKFVLLDVIKHRLLAKLMNYSRPIEPDLSKQTHA
jgi:hypothetical protein